MNWENPKVREFVWETMSFWLDQGVDGFRVSLGLSVLVSYKPLIMDDCFVFGFQMDVS